MSTHYLGIDIGGSKTLVATLDAQGVILEKIKFPTPHDYDDFLIELKKTLQDLEADDFEACAVAVPGLIDRQHGIGRRFGNLPWKNVPLLHDIERITHCPTVLEHDPSLAGLSEAMLVKHVSKVLYVTVSTGIGAGLIVDRQIDENFAVSEAGMMMLEHKGRLEPWESFASGSAIVRRYGKMAKDIHDEATWKAIGRDIAHGMQQLLAITEPDLVVIGGSVGRYFDNYAHFLRAELKKYQNPLVPIPPFKAAERPDDAVVYGCYDLARAKFPHHLPHARHASHTGVGHA
jgi:predicted NBD/HSP70 family sugar kinase